MAINQSFPYEKLPNTQSFRLLEIENGDSNCPISCTLRSHSLETAPLYQALSYVWGPPATTNGKSIQCNGHDFFVTDNLYGALHRLREMGDCCLIWIDQICINQNDLQERCQQVSIMRDIYSKAQLVNAWLGVTDSPESARVVEMISIMASSTWLGMITSDDPVDDETLESLGLPAQDSPTWVALNNMLALPYFSRVWIIQEIAVAKSYRILWGNIIIPGATFLGSTKGWLLIPRVLKNWATAHAMKNAILVLVGVHQSKDWPFLVTRFVEHEATDPHDKIYAFIGLADQTGYDIAADYSKPVVEVYQGFVRKAIAVTEKLDILRFSTVQDLDTKTGPLWVPWFHKLQKHPIPSQEEAQSSKNTKARRGEDTDQGTLTLRGIRADTVAIAIMPFMPSADFLEKVKTTISESDPRLSEEMVMDALGCGPLNWILRAFDMMKQHEDVILARNGVGLITLLLSALTSWVNPYFYLADFREYLSSALMRLLVMEDKKDEMRILLGLLRHVLQVYPPTLERQAIFDDEEEIQELGNILAEVYDSQDEIDSSIELVKSLKIPPPTTGRNDISNNFKVALEAELGRMFFITELGYVGIGPMSMNPGDHLCVLYGGRTPFIVRPVEGAGDEDYLFLGETFVNGLMKGEALDDEGATEKWFRLR
ncbi:heterokaryon incompatibility 6 OR allele [Fusarium pseudoanthophilum]|uniref:Heterokaryon incompatibility 6 OR allele n=1 Tax=Fusarium pseudoanthophilum TaxID=48495 RepID=A0A8H5P6N8_9HYPO|nr:heterokaryon incompatibility 6 OR allele [Fusarium pseudoanthophilum]